MNALHVVDQLRLAQELVPLGSLRQLLDVVHSDGDQKIHHDHPDEDDEGKDGNMCESRKMVEVYLIFNLARVRRGAVAHFLCLWVHQLFILKLSSHHNQHLESESVQGFGRMVCVQ